MKISCPVSPFANPVVGFRSKPYFRFRASSTAPTPDFFSSEWLESRKKRSFGPKLDFSAEEAVQCQLVALKYNDQPRQDYGIEVMYRFERFRRLFHHSTYRVLLCHKDHMILSSLWVKEDQFKQRVLVQGSRPEEEEIFQFTMFQRIGGCWDGYWLTESLLHDRDVFLGGVAY